jgi:hypothetical protein
MTTAGLVALLITLPLSIGWRETIVGVMIAMGLGVAVSFRLIGGTWIAGKGERPRWRARLASLREAVLTFSAGHPARLWRVFLLHSVFHILSFAEVFLALRWLVGRPTIAQALVFSALDRVVVVAFKFVPFRVGVDEASSGGMAVLLGWAAAAGVTLAIVKKVRSLVWTAVGLLLIAAHPARGAPATDPPGSARAHRT